MALGDQPANAHTGFLQAGVAELPYFFGSRTVQNALITEKAAQLQMAPVVQRIADGLAQHLSPLQEFVVIAGVAGDVFFLHSGAAHQPPFVMVAAQPDLRDVVVA